MPPELEPKYKGWRALVHAPTGLMFNRYGQPLSISAEFASPLQCLRKIVLRPDGIAVKWFDCEALDRRHALGRGTLMVFDYLMAMAVEPWEKRKQILAQALPEHDYRQVPLPEALYGVPAQDPAQIDPQELYRQLRQLNARWGCQFYEGLVAKRTTDAYPLQLPVPIWRGKPTWRQSLPFGRCLPRSWQLPMVVTFGWGNACRCCALKPQKTRFKPQSHLLFGRTSALWISRHSVCGLPP